jgi:hypothetical protein
MRGCLGCLGLLLLGPLVFFLGACVGYQLVLLFV